MNEVRRHVLLDHTDPGLVDEVENLSKIQRGLEARIDSLQEGQMMIDPKEFGRMQANLESLRRDFDLLSLGQREIVKTLAEINTQLSEARGGWKTLVAIGGLAGLAGAALTKVAVWWAQVGIK